MKGDVKFDVANLLQAKFFLDSSQMMQQNFVSYIVCSMFDTC